MQTVNFNWVWVEATEQECWATHNLLKKLAKFNTKAARQNINAELFYHDKTSHTVSKWMKEPLLRMFIDQHFCTLELTGTKLKT